MALTADRVVVELEAKPAPGGPVTSHVFVSKTADGAEGVELSPEAVTAALAKMTPEQQGMALMKAAQRNPIRL